MELFGFAEPPGVLSPASMMSDAEEYKNASTMSVSDSICYLLCHHAYHRDVCTDFIHIWYNGQEYYVCPDAHCNSLALCQSVAIMTHLSHSLSLYCNVKVRQGALSTIYRSSCSQKTNFNHHMNICICSYWVQ